MDQEIQSKLQDIHKKHLTIWFTVLFGMLALIAVLFVAYFFGFIDPIPVVNPAVADKITMFAILVILIISFYIKRSALSLSKIIDKAGNTKISLDSNFWSIQADDKKKEMLAAAVQIIGRNRLIVWFMADLIIIVSVINFILAPVLNSFYIYCIVAIYSLSINYPSYKSFSRIYNYIYEN